MILIDGKCKAVALDASAVLLVKAEEIKREASLPIGSSRPIERYRAAPQACCAGTPEVRADAEPPGTLLAG
jgi:hypothetical protein